VKVKHYHKLQCDLYISNLSSSTQLCIQIHSWIISSISTTEMSNFITYFESSFAKYHILTPYCVGLVFIYCYTGEFLKINLTIILMIIRFYSCGQCIWHNSLCFPTNHSILAIFGKPCFPQFFIMFVVSIKYKHFKMSSQRSGDMTLAISSDLKNLFYD
jgi:hypothetical protein